MSKEGIPRDKKLYFEDGKAFYYERGHRIYVEGVESPQYPIRIHPIEY